MIGQSMREVMNPECIEAGSANIAQAFLRIQNNNAINYHGAYSNNDFDSVGYIVGTLVYDIHLFEKNKGAFERLDEVVIEISPARIVYLIKSSFAINI
ncbi:MAG: hypothetical protein ACI89U_001836 [Gammaproteobacteria bacterium]|jgi:hypothetical protein